MDQIRLLVILAYTQKHLATIAGLKPKCHFLLSHNWRNALGPKHEIEKCMQKAHSLLASCELNEATRKLVDSDNALRFVSEYVSVIQRLGEQHSTCGQGLQWV